MWSRRAPHRRISLRDELRRGLESDVICIVNKSRPIASDHDQIHWEVEIDGQWHRVGSQALPDSVRSKKSVRFAYHGGIIDVTDSGGGIRRYRLVRNARS